MRILLVTRNIPAKTIIPVDRGGGADTFIGSLLALPGSYPDLEIDVVTLSPEGQPIEPPPLVRIKYVPADHLHGWLWKHREARNPFAALTILFLTATMLAREALRAARKRDYDIIYAVGGPVAGLAGAIVKRARGLPLAMHFQYTYHFREASPLVRFFAKALYLQTNALIGNCPMLGKDAVGLGISPSVCHWVYNWIDHSLFRPLEPRSLYRERWGIRPEQTVFYFGGRFCPSKQVDCIIEALRGFHDPRAVFLFAGDGVLRPQLDALARDNANIRLLGTVAREKLPELHAAADVQFWGSVDVDYPGLVVMEAMSSGLPVYTSEETMNFLYAGEKVQPEFLGAPAYARLFPPNAQGIRAAINEAIERRDELNALRGGVAEFARKSFGNENALRLIGILRSVASPSGQATQSEPPKSLPLRTRI